MKIDFTDGHCIDTDKLPDADALLLEETNKLRQLYEKYNRQLYLVAEIRAHANYNMDPGICFYNFGPDSLKDDHQKLRIEIARCMARLNNCIRFTTNETLHIVPIEN